MDKNIRKLTGTALAVILTATVVFPLLVGIYVTWIIAREL